MSTPQASTTNDRSTVQTVQNVAPVQRSKRPKIEILSDLMVENIRKLFFTYAQHAEVGDRIKHFIDRTFRLCLEY